MTGPSDHLVAVGERWSVWRCVALRGAGLPLNLLNRLSFPGAAADREAFVDAVARTAARLPELAADPRFREAMTWQNRHALRDCVDALLARPVSRDGRRPSRVRYKEALVARYLQRYCAKNDTIGFFGPVGWAAIADDGPAIVASPGRRLLASRTTYVEGWCVDRLGQLLADDPAMQPWLAPRVPPSLRLAGDTLHAPLAAPAALSEAEAAVLALCDGLRTARDIAAQLAAAGTVNEHEVFAVLRKLRSARRIVWTLEVPADDLFPEQALAVALRRVGADDVRQRAERVVAELVAHRDAVAASANDPHRLDTAIAATETWFSELTSTAPTRRAGQTYAGRTLLYEDCRRDLQLTLGPELIAALGPPLDLLLAAGRWFTEHAIDRFRQALVARYDRLAARGGTPVPMPNLWLYAQDLLFGDDDDLVATLAADVRRRWALVLGDPPPASRLVRSAAELHQAVERAFAVDRVTPGITRYCCPDVMIAATDQDAIRRGDYHFVLGELHAGLNTLTSAVFGAQHPVPAQLVRAIEHDLPDPTVVPLFSREAPGVTTRMMRSLVRDRDLRLLYAHDTCGVPRSRALPIASLVAERADDGLQVRSLDGGLRFDVMAIFAELALIRAHRAFGIFAPAPHTPRLTIDRLVVERERWRLPAGKLPFAWITDEWDRFCELDRWRQAHGVPQHVFVMPSPGDKPIYVDLAAPVFADVFARIVRGAADRQEPISMSEMLPGPDQAWLTDGQGHRYTCELRMVAIDRH